ncbi:putative enhancer of polycomb-like protein [Lyophyllum shimeji]|uniref:Enhancer of polycomb-like protein n=1 Tax=Lyophyllum shimeji TaxID=47721 RepID=A0A9P3UU17_LYOSH|nr:putative enhancer of polycomb-like protein [Lyophyllum shimeji]
MPRNLHTGAPSRPRARITQKTRLKIFQGDLDSDVLLIPDEDEEKTRLTNLVAGVDAEDANEHHLQAVLSATAHAPPPPSRPTRGAAAAADKAKERPAAYIPTPDSTGIVENYEELYPANRWRDPATYLASSSTVEASSAAALADGFTYYMDERDKEWLDKNNEEARGEGTSAQGSISTATRTSARSAKGKGKEPETVQPLVITEDEFELVMGLFEKVTHEKTEYLHHGLENGMSFPSFAEYQETFSSPLPAPTFASYSVPSWVPPPAHLLRMARVVYPYWKERRLERGGHRIIPTLNFDEADTLNESYICFRRREVKAVRKTRATQAPASDKLIRLQAELSYPLELAKAVLERETRKKDAVEQTKQVWEKRMGLADLARKYPSLSEKGDEELLIDKEKPKKVDVTRPAKIKPEPGVQPRVEVAIKPSERTALINEAIETALARQKERDHHWEDQIDNPYQAPPVPHANRLFKYIPVNFLASEADGRPILDSKRQPRAVRARRGRGGRLIIDRRAAAPPPIVDISRSSLFERENVDVEMSSPDEERDLRIAERWRYDADDVPAVGPEGPEEQGRVLVDDYAPRILSHSMTILGEMDQQNLVTDPSIPVLHEGHQRTVLPYRLGMTSSHLRRNVPRPPPPKGFPQLPHAAAPKPPTPSGNVPVSIQQQMMKMPPPSGVPQTRIPSISSNGGMRPPTSTPTTQGTTSVPQSPAPNTATPAQHPVPTTNGISRAAINLPHVDVNRPDLITSQSSLGGAIQMPQPAQADPSQAHELKVNGSPGSVTNPHTPHLGMVANGYHPLTTQAAAALANSAQYAAAYQAGQHGLTSQQMQNLKTTFANMPQGQDLQSVARALPAYLQVPASGPRNSIFSS